MMLGHERVDGGAVADQRFERKPALTKGIVGKPGQQYDRA
jgi:hypothetical protein